MQLFSPPRAAVLPQRAPATATTADALGSPAAENEMSCKLKDVNATYTLLHIEALETNGVLNF